MGRKPRQCMSDNLLLVFANAADGRDDEFNKWYDEVHIVDVCAVPGVAGARRYEVEAREGAPTPRHRYLTVYDVDGDPQEVLAEFGRRAADGSMPLSDA